MFLIILNILLLISPDKLKDDINLYLKQQLRNYDRFEFEIVTLPKGEINEIRIIRNRDLKVNGEIVYIPVELVEKNRVTSSFITCRLKLYKKVFVAGKKISKGEALLNSFLETKEMDVTRLGDKIITDFAEINSKRARTDISQGSILIKDYLEPIPVVRVDDRVLAFYTRGNVEISFDAIAKQEGIIGDVIRIINNEKKLFRAKIIDSLTVKIIE